MKVHMKTKKKKLGEFKPGTCFVADGLYYIVTDNGEGDGFVVAVRLYDGHYVCYSDAKVVGELDAEVVVND